MKFESLHEDVTCDCIENAEQDYVNIYSRKIGKPNLKPKDLETHWERGKRPEHTDCESICGFKGLSVNIWNEQSRESTLSKFLKTFSITPSRKDSIYVFKFKKDAGLIKHTPYDEDLFHHDFYKCDDFTEEMLEQVEIISLRDLLNKTNQ